MKTRKTGMQVIKDSLTQVKTDCVKKIIIIMLACVLSACLLATCSLFLIRSFTNANAEEPSTTELVSTSEKILQTQINDLSRKLTAFNSAVSQLQAQTKSAGEDASPAPVATDQPVMLEILTLTESIKTVSASVDTLQTQMNKLQESLKGSTTMIGITPITVNGLSLTFITNSVNTGITGSTTPNAAQFAIKIANLTNSTLNNLDITGIISSTQSLSENMVSGYPQLTDGSSLCTYVFSNGPSSNILNFEAYGIGKTSLTIPANGSITLRPKLTIMASANNKIPASIFTISLNTITYDVGTTK